MTSNLLILLRINWPQCMHFPPVGPGGAWPPSDIWWVFGWRLIDCCKMVRAVGKSNFKFRWETIQTGGMQCPRVPFYFDHWMCIHSLKVNFSSCGCECWCLDLTLCDSMHALVILFITDTEDRHTWPSALSGAIWRSVKVGINGIIFCFTCSCHFQEFYH